MSISSREHPCVLYTDGASRGNPGHGAAGFVLYDAQGGLLVESGVYLGICTNNEAEYQAAILGVQAAQALQIQYLILRADSELMVRQLLGQYRVKNERLLTLFLPLKKLISTFESVSIQHIRRESNALADRQANLAIEKHLQSR